METKTYKTRRRSGRTGALSLARWARQAAQVVEPRQTVGCRIGAAAPVSTIQSRKIFVSVD